MNKKLKKILKICLASIFIVSTTGLVMWMIETKEAMEIYHEAEKMAVEESAEELVVEGETLHNINIDALKAYNEDVIGWIRIPDTPVDYPLVQGADNQFYLNHTWNKDKNAVGSIFLEQTNISDFSDFNTLIYGHYMRNNSMFGSLEEYKSQEYWKEHPYIYIYNQKGTLKYEVFACYEANVSAETYRINYTNNKKLQEFLDMCVGKSVIDTGIYPTNEDKILTLSTCIGNGTYRARWVVQAILVEAEDGTAIETSQKAEIRNSDYLIDYAPADEGYVSVQCLKEDLDMIKVQVEGPANTYTYDVKGTEERTFPLTDGNGEYKISVCENTEDNKYSAVLSANVTIELKDTFAPFLRSNEYIAYEDAESVLEWAEEAAGKHKDTLKKTNAVFKYVMNNVAFKNKAETEELRGTIPDISKVIEKKKGNSFEYAALMTGMLRSQGVPCKLVYGYDGEVYRIWISVWTEEVGWNKGIIYFDGETWFYQEDGPEMRMDDEKNLILDPERGESKETIMETIDGLDIESNYLDKYIY